MLPTKSTMSPIVVVSSCIALIALIDYAEAVIGGDPAEEGQFPYVVAILDIDGTSLCGGAIVSESHVLTAGHCVHNINRESIVVIAGITNFLTVANENIYEISTINVHPAFEPEQVIPVPHSPGEYTLIKETQNDIAIVQVDRSFDFTGNLAMAWIATVFPNSYHYCSFAGWGVTDDRMEVSDELMFTHLAIKRSDECATINCAHAHGQICVYDRHRTSTTCSGDSGGPLVCQGRIIGIASTSDCDILEPVGFVNVLEYLPFITSVLIPSATGRR